MKVQRYDACDGALYEDSGGDYVRYADLALLLAAFEELKAYREVVEDALAEAKKARAAAREADRSALDAAEGALEKWECGDGTAWMSGHDSHALESLVHETRAALAKISEARS